MPELSPEEVDDLLARVHHGRLGVVDEAGVYVVPVGFVMAEGDLWFHSAPGRKTAALERDPRCCFEVDEYHQQTAAWKSVIVFGEARPDSSPAAWSAMRSRFGHVLAQVMKQPAQADGSGQGAGSRGRLYRLRISELSGRRGP